MRALEKRDNENCANGSIPVESCNGIHNPKSEHTFIVFVLI